MGCSTLVSRFSGPRFEISRYLQKNWETTPALGGPPHASWNRGCHSKSRAIGRSRPCHSVWAPGQSLAAGDRIDMLLEWCTLSPCWCETLQLFAATQESVGIVVTEKAQNFSPARNGH